ncbi:hypothetical protein ABKN59_011159 [Abortiporus biennis]
MSTTPTDITFRPTVSLGSLYIGTTLSAIISGITCVQVYDYFGRASRQDHTILKVSMMLLFLLDLFTTILAVLVTKYFTIDNANNVAAIWTIPWSCLAFICLATINDLIVRSIFIYRIWKLSSSSISAIILSTMNLAVAGFCFALDLRIAQLGDFGNLSGISWLVKCSFGGMAFLDSLLALILVLMLWRMKTGFYRTDSQLESLMRYSIHTGALTSLVAIAVIISYHYKSDEFIFIGIYATLPKFYLSALLATINARDSIRLAIPGAMPGGVMPGNSSEHSAVLSPKFDSREVIGVFTSKWRGGIE